MTNGRENRGHCCRPDLQTQAHNGGGYSYYSLHFVLTSVFYSKCRAGKSEHAAGLPYFSAHLAIRQFPCMASHSAAVPVIPAGRKRSLGNHELALQRSHRCVHQEGAAAAWEPQAGPGLQGNRRAGAEHAAHDEVHGGVCNSTYCPYM